MLYLASQSPRRRDLLDQLGLHFGLLDVDVLEARDPNELAESYVSRVARDKARAGLQCVLHVPAAIVLGADTEVVLGDEVFGKPRSAADAAAMLRRLSGRTHRVLSAVWVVSAGREDQALVETEVDFAPLMQVEIDNYIAHGEPFGKAGAYAIQGRGAAFVAGLRGSYSGVVGLPLYETARLLRGFGITPQAVAAKPE